MATYNTAPVFDLIVHEFAHARESDHLSDRYYRALTEIAGKMVALALRSPELFVLNRHDAGTTANRRETCAAG